MIGWSMNKFFKILIILYFITQVYGSVKIVNEDVIPTRTLKSTLALAFPHKYNSEGAQV